ncbi:MAG: hypothetical protein ACFFE8_10695 [Candidatus Heimdallarchaeota archaeon]
MQSSWGEEFQIRVDPFAYSLGCIGFFAPAAIERSSPFIPEVQ